MQVKNASEFKRPCQLLGTNQPRNDPWLFVWVKPLTREARKSTNFFFKAETFRCPLHKIWLDERATPVQSRVCVSEEILLSLTETFFSRKMEIVLAVGSSLHAEVPF